MIRFSCPNCHRSISAPDHVAGKHAKCPGCDQPIAIPAPIVEEGFEVIDNPELVSDFEVVDEPAQQAVKATAKPVARKLEADVIEDFEVIDDEPKQQLGGRKAAPEVVEDFEIVDEAPKSAVKPASKAPAKLAAKSGRSSIQPKPARRSDDDIPVVEAVVADEPKAKRRRRDEDDDEFDDDDFDDRPRRKRRRGPKDGTPMGDYGYAICYNCGADAGSRVTWTFWGGIIGPALISHVRCGRCGTTYNGRSGKSNNTAILIYILVTLGISFAIIIAGAIAAATK
jgi:hypothetical protein